MDKPRFNPEAKDGMLIPASCFTPTGRGENGLDEALMLQWVCPDLTYAEAGEVARAGEGSELKMDTLRMLVRQEWPRLMAGRRMAHLLQAIERKPSSPRQSDYVAEYGRLAEQYGTPVAPRSQ